MLRALLTPRWLALLVAAAALAAGCVAAGRWQLDRFEQRRAEKALVTANLDRAPVPVEELLDPDRPVGRDLTWRGVTATGRYDAGEELLVRNRTLQRRLGFHVLTPLVTDEGTALLVNRGWVPAAGSARERPEVPAPPSGEVAVTARLREGERGGPSPADLPAGEVNRIDVATISHRLGYPVYAGYAELVGQDPAPSGDLPELLPPPEPGLGPHLAYAVQWFLFAGLVPVGLVLLARQETRGRREAGYPG